MRHGGVILAAAVWLTQGVLWAGERLGMEVEASFYTQYVWRGVVQTKGPVLQTSTTATYKGAHFNLFTTQDLNRVNHLRGKFGEIDYEAGYDFALERSTLSVGVLRNTYPCSDFEPTTEIYAGAAWAGPLDLSARGYIDVEAIHGFYLTADATHRLHLPRISRNADWQLAFSAGLGIGSANHNEEYYGVKRWAAADLHPALALPIALGKFRITPRWGYSLLLSRRLREGPALQAHGTTAGLSVSYGR